MYFPSAKESMLMIFFVLIVFPDFCCAAYKLVFILHDIVKYPLVSSILTNTLKADACFQLYSSHCQKERRKREHYTQQNQRLLNVIKEKNSANG